jgi:hypothetical protein
MRLIFGAAAAIAPVAALLFDAEAGLAAEGVSRIPMSCCSELKRLPNRFCADATGICAAVLLLSLESVDRSDSESFL